MQTLTHNKGTRVDLLHSLPRKSVCAELGVFEGTFSAAILKHCHPKHFYLVDLFHGIIPSGDEDGFNIHTADMDKMRWELEVRFGSDPVTVVASDSIEWLANQHQGSLDWIYLDTNHEFEQTAGELIAARSAVRHGGWICGHDYRRDSPGVIQAVDYFVMYHRLPLEIWTGDLIPSFKITNWLHLPAEQPAGSGRLP